MRGCLSAVLAACLLGWIATLVSGTHHSGAITAVLAIVALLAVLLQQATNEDDARTEQLQAMVDGQQRLREAFANSPLQPVSAPINLQPGETCYWAGPADEVQRVKHSQRIGVYGGPSVRVARGLYLRGGVSRSQSVSSERPEIIDSGMLCVTNRRVVFAGARSSKAYALEKILSFEAHADSIAINMANKPRTVFVTNNPAAGWTLQRVSAGQIDAPLDVAALRARLDAASKTVADGYASGNVTAAEKAQWDAMEVIERKKLDEAAQGHDDG